MARCAKLIEQVRLERTELTFTEAFLFLKIGHSSDVDAFEHFLHRVSDDEAADYASTHADDRNFMRLAFAFLEPHEMPTHSHLADLLVRWSQASSRNAEKFDHLATMLGPWRNDTGNHGKLVDGVTNVSFSGSHVHIELSKIGESGKELRGLAAFLVTNQIRNEIMNRPKHLRKRIVLEELGGFRAIPQGEQVVTEFYSRMRKYSTWVISVVQQKTMLGESAAAASLLGNSRIGIFLRQSDPSELEEISKSFPLPDSTKESILGFNDPSREQGAPFVYVHKGSKPIIATGRHIVLDEDPTNEGSESEATGGGSPAKRRMKK
ncbi:MAG: hypothetical protein KDN22_10090 [Verrucomicrobiae bacterium]|nr:hypothetical protein [Verrucomicrobiae bacterium]